MNILNFLALEGIVTVVSIDVSLPLDVAATLVEYAYPTDAPAPL